MNRRAVVLGTAAALAAPARVRAQSAAPITIRLASTANDDITDLIYGQNSGLFHNVGIDIAFQKANSGSAVAAAVASGAIDLGKSSPIPVINAHARGIPFAAVAPAGVHRATSLDSGLVVANDGPHSARELDDKIVSVAGLQDSTWLAACAWLDQNGGHSERVHFVEVPGSSVLYALEQGRIVAGTMSEPYITENVRSGKARLLADTLNAIAPRWLLGLYFCTIDYAGKNRELIARFRKALGEAAAYCNTHQAETVPMMSQLTGIDPATLAQATRAYFPAELDPRDIQPAIDAAARYKLIPQRFDARDLLAHPSS